MGKCEKGIKKRMDFLEWEMRGSESPGMCSYITFECVPCVILVRCVSGSGDRSG